MTTSIYEDVESPEEATQESVQRKTSAQSAAEQQNSEARDEVGAPTDESYAQVSNKIRGGLAKTAESLGILGAGAPYASGEY